MTLDEIRKLIDEAAPVPLEGVATHYSGDHAEITVRLLEAMDGLASRGLHEFVAAARTLLPALLKVAEAANAVLSEDGVKEYLSAYVMGVELIERLAALNTGAEAEKHGSDDWESQEPPVTITRTQFYEAFGQCFCEEPYKTQAVETTLANMLARKLGLEEP